MSTDRTGQAPSWARWPWAILIIFAAAVATRAVTFGNPLVDMDDQFYWLVGRSWWQGEWPIVDIWDRKPVGLFLLYAAISGIDRSILAVQLAALLFTAGTAVLIRAAALHIASPRAALFAGLTYLVMLPPFWGQSGQSPVFYNLFMAGAAVLLLHAAGDSDPLRVRRRALLAMMLSGLALMCKQVSVAEGIYFGLAFLWLLWRQGRPVGSIIGTGAAMAAIALLPTLLGAALYLLRGEGAVAAYVQSSYWSIFAKTPGAGQSLLNGVYYLLIFGGALIVTAGIGLTSGPRAPAERLHHRLIAGWIAAAVVGYLLVPNFFPHYALPLLVPLSVMAARAFDRPIGPALLLVLLVSSLLTGRLTDLAGNHRAARDYERLVSTVEAARQGGCIYVANGPVSLYTAAPDCGVTRYLFPYHLTLATEATAVGVDQAAEIARVFAARAAVVVTQDDKRGKQTEAVRATIDRHLATGYRPILEFPADSAEELRSLRVWQRKDLAQ